MIVETTPKPQDNEKPVIENSAQRWFKIADGAFVGTSLKNGEGTITTNKVNELIELIEELWFFLLATQASTTM